MHTSVRATHTSIHLGSKLAQVLCTIVQYWCFDLKHLWKCIMTRTKEFSNALGENNVFITMNHGSFCSDIAATPSPVNWDQPYSARFPGVILLFIHVKIPKVEVRAWVDCDHVISRMTHHCCGRCTVKHSNAVSDWLQKRIKSLFLYVSCYVKCLSF